MDNQVDGEEFNAEQSAIKKKGVEDADDAAKIFVGGLHWETSIEDLKNYFERFGTVEDCTVKTDPNTGRSRGFGFVLFSNAESVDKVLAESSHTLSGKNIDPKRAKARGPEPIKKVFVGGIDPNTPESEIREYFGQFGKIEELILPFDKANNVRKSFAFITFDSEAAVEQLCVESKHTVGSKQVEVKKAVPKPEFPGSGGGRGGFGGFRGSGRGDFGQRGGRGSFRGGARGRFAGAGSGGGGAYGAYGQDAWSGYGGGYDGGYGYGGGYPSGGGYDYSGYGQQYTQYGAAGGYDYSGWYGQQAAGQANGGGYGRAARGGTMADARYQPYSR